MSAGGDFLRRLRRLTADKVLSKRIDDELERRGEIPDLFHAPAAGGLFAGGALCGATAATEPDGSLWVYEPGPHVTCVECRRLMLEGA